jgi:hypothetical protein
MLLLALASSAHGYVEAGKAQFVFGDVRALGTGGLERAINKGDVVLEGDTVVTGASASAQLRMVDQAVIAVRPNSRLRIVAYRLGGDSERGVLHLLKGGLRSMTGRIGRVNRENYKIITDGAAIGIRGTDHEPMYLPAAPGETALGAAGTYDRVNTGGTYLASPAGRVDLSSNEVGFASIEPNVVPIRLAAVPGFMRAAPGIQEWRSRKPSAERDQQPARVTAPGAEDPKTDGDGFRGLRHARAFDVDPEAVRRKRTRDGSVEFTGAFAGGAPRLAGVYGDRTAGVMRNGAFTAVKEPADSFFADSAQALAATDPASKLVYTRGAVPIVASGNASFADGGTMVTVNWGIYGTGAAVDGHNIQDAFTGGTGRKPDYVQVMGALETPAAVVSTLSGTYSGIIASTPVIAESGAPGGSVTSAAIVLANGALTQYQVGVTDGLSRDWSASCPSCSSGVPLNSFKTVGVALSGTGPTGGVASGQASGQPVGPSGQGVTSSFALQSGSAAITGSFAVTK